jgi:hypothetical protein
LLGGGALQVEKPEPRPEIDGRELLRSGGGGVKSFFATSTPHAAMKDLTPLR